MVVPTQEIKNKITTKEKQLADLQKNYQASLREAQTMRETGVKNPEIKSFVKDVTNEYNRNRQFAEGELKGLREGLTRVKKGEQLATGDVERYARSVGAYQEQLEQAEQKRKQVKPKPTIPRDLQRERAVRDMEAARLREQKATTDTQRARAVRDMEAARLREDLQKRQLSKAETIKLKSETKELKTRAPFQEEPKDYSKYFIKEPVTTIFAPDDQGMSMIRKDKEIPQIFKTYTGDVFARYKSGERILIDQQQSFLPPDTSKEGIRKEKGLIPLQVKKEKESPSIFSLGVSKIKEFETGKAQEKQNLLNRYLAGEQLTFLEKQKISVEIKNIEKPKTDVGGFSIFQTYLELVGKGKRLLREKPPKDVPVPSMDLTFGRTFPKDTKQLSFLPPKDVSVPTMDLTFGRTFPKDKKHIKLPPPPKDVSVPTMDLTFGVKFPKDTKHIKLPPPPKDVPVPSMDLTFGVKFPKDTKHIKLPPPPKDVPVPSMDLTFGRTFPKDKKSILKPLGFFLTKDLVPEGGRKEKINFFQDVAPSVSKQKEEKRKESLEKIGAIGSVFKTIKEYEGDIKFYGKGEREKITQETLREFTEAKDYEAQQKAIENLKKKGINISLKNGEYVVDTKGIAPTSKWGNILVGTGDILLKGAIFSPYMTTGATKKTTTKVKVKSDVVYRRKFSELSDMEYSELINKIRVSKSPAELREALIKALKSGSKEKIDDTAKILKDVMGESKASTLIKDVLTQEGYSSVSKAVTKPSTTTLELDITDLFNVRPIPLVKETTAVSSIFDSGNRFEGTKPTGGISSLTDTGKIGGLGELGKISSLEVSSTIFDTGEKQKDGTITRTRQETKTKTKESLASASSLLTGLSQPTALKQPSLLKQPQALRQPEALKQPSLLKQPQALRQPEAFKTPQIFTPSRGRYKYPEETPTFGFGFGWGRRKKPIGKQQIYDAYVLRDATKTKKRRWEKVADNVSRKTALSIGSREVDTSISSRFKIKKDTKAKKISKIKDSSWDNISYKFRQFKQKGGVKIQTPMTFYERSRHRLDSPGETKKIQAEKRKSINVRNMFGF